MLEPERGSDTSSIGPQCVVGIDVPCPCVTVEQHTHRHRTGTSSAKMVVLSPTRPLTPPRRPLSPHHLPPKRVEAPGKAGAGVPPALRHHPRRAQPQRLHRGALQVAASPGIWTIDPSVEKMHPHGELPVEVDESERAVWLSMVEVDAMLDVVRGRVTNGFRARRRLAVEVEVRGPCSDVTAVRGRRPPRKWFADDTYIHANRNPTSAPHHRLRRAAVRI
jgi:hypothetical protein